MAGVRSEYAARQFAAAGYTNVANYIDGWLGWNDSWTPEQWREWSRRTNFPSDEEKELAVNVGFPGLASE